MSHSLPRLRRLLLILCTGILGTCALLPALGLDFDQLQQSLMSRFGPAPVSLFRDWQRTVTESKALPENDKLKKINDFFNRRIAFDDDITIWGQTDYWATPLESMGKGRADCEDFSIAKYFSLIAAGVPVNKLRLVYVKAMQNGATTGASQQAHMVLAYYPTPTGDPLVLDNLVVDIRPASRRPDLSPVFSFNSAGLWQGTGNQSSKSNLSRWQDLLQRARNEGFE